MSWIRRRRKPAGLSDADGCPLADPTAKYKAFVMRLSRPMRTISCWLSATSSSIGRLAPCCY